MDMQGLGVCVCVDMQGLGGCARSVNLKQRSLPPVRMGSNFNKHSIEIHAPLDIFRFIEMNVRKTKVHKRVCY